MHLNFSSFAVVMSRPVHSASEMDQWGEDTSKAEEDKIFVDVHLNKFGNALISTTTAEVDKPRII